MRRRRRRRGEEEEEEERRCLQEEVPGTLAATFADGGDGTEATSGGLGGDKVKSKISGAAETGARKATLLFETDITDCSPSSTISGSMLVLTFLLGTMNSRFCISRRTLIKSKDDVE